MSNEKNTRTGKPLTVGELIEHLKQFPPELGVLVSGLDDFQSPIQLTSADVYEETGNDKKRYVYIF